MKKFFYFAVNSSIDGTDTDEEAIMVPADNLVVIEPNSTTEVTMIFAGEGVGNIGSSAAQAKDVIAVQLNVTAANFKEFCRQIALYCNADGTAGRWTKDGMLVVAEGTTGFHSSVTACASIVIASGTA
jgi:hypothetical protein